MRIEPGRCANCTGTPPLPNGRSLSRAASAPPSIDPHGLAETNDFDPGDVWYFPRGHGHMLQCLGDKPCHFILIFDNGYFSEFGTFSITDWIGHTPQAAAGEELWPAGSDVRRLSRRRKCISPAARVRPTEPRCRCRAGSCRRETHKYRLLAQPPHATFEGGREWRVDSSRFPISKTMTGVVLDLDPGALRELHWHPNADEWQYVMEGEVSVTLFGSHGRYRTETLEKGDVGYIPQGYGHSIENVGDGRCAHADRI